MNTNEIELNESNNSQVIIIDDNEIKCYYCTHKLIDNTIKDSCEICDLEPIKIDDEEQELFNDFAAKAPEEEINVVEDIADSND